MHAIASLGASGGAIQLPPPPMAARQDDLLARRTEAHTTFHACLEGVCENLWVVQRSCFVLEVLI